MPLVLMLEDVFEKFSRWIKRLDQWNQLVSLEETLVGRARSAFLVHWFGPQVPLQDSHLRVYIANLGELRAKYNAVKKVPGYDADKPSLLEPTAGFAGTLIGMLGAPFNSAFLYEWLFKVKQEWYTGAFAIVNIISLGFLGTALTALAGVFSLVALPWATSEEASGFIDLLARIAPGAIKLRGLWKQILGPRRDVKDPVFRQVLLLGDAVAQLLPHLIGFAAIVLGRIGKLIQPLWNQAKALIDFAKFMTPLIQRVILNTLDLVKHFFSKKGENSLLRPFLLVFAFVEHKILPVIDEMLASLLAPLPMLLSRGHQIAKWWEKVSALFEKRFIEGGIPTLIDELAKRLGLVSKLWAKATPPPPPPPPPSPPTPPSALDKALAALIVWIRRRIGPSKPFPTLTLPDVPLLERLLGKPALSLSEADIKKEAKRLLKSSKIPAELILTLAEKKQILARPPDVFGAEQRKLEFSVRSQYPGLGKEEAPGAPYVEERQLRMLLFEAARRMLMPDLAGQILKLEPVFRKAEEKLQIRRHPIKQLDEFKELRPVIGELRIGSSQGTQDTLNKWSVSLRRALAEQYYEVAVA